MVEFYSVFCDGNCMAGNKAKGEKLMPIHKKILEIMKDIEYLRKDDNVEFGNTKYRGLTEEKVTKEVRAALVRHSVVVYPIEQTHRREPIGTKGSVLSIVDTKYRFVDVEDDTMLDAVSSGSGADTQDKGVGKAMTYSYKYLFLRTLAIPTGEDPDKICSEQLDAEDEKRAQVHLNKRADEGREKIKQMLADYENTFAPDELDAIDAELKAADTFDKVTSLFRKFSRKVKAFEIESMEDNPVDLGMKKASEIGPDDHADQLDIS